MFPAIWYYLHGHGVTTFGSRVYNNLTVICIIYGGYTHLISEVQRITSSLFQHNDLQQGCRLSLLMPVI